jgi:hypothetical protein
MADGGGDEEGGVIIPFPATTPQVKGRLYEQKRSRQLGLRLHPASGAGRIKHDASDEGTVVEFKQAERSFTLQGKYLEGLFKEATRQDKTAIMEINFKQAGITATLIVRRTP